MGLFRKLPVEVEARRLELDGGNASKLAEWCGGEYMPAGLGAGAAVRIVTLEGAMEASPGDWIIRGVAGEFYPCKPHIFDVTYEPVD